MRIALASGVDSVAVIAVTGLAGVGKTQLAVEHAWRRAAEYDLVWWVSAEAPASVPGALAPLADALHLPNDQLEVVIDLLQTELARRSRWLLIFDNAEDPAAIAAFLPPSGGGHVVVTSRNPVWRSKGTVVNLPVWDRDDAVAFLLGRTGSEDAQAASDVADELGLLPLALEQASAYVEETGMALAAYQKHLALGRAQLLHRGTPAFYRATVATTFGLAYQRAAELNCAAAEMLETCAFLAPDDIPTELVANADSLTDEDALATLRRLGLVRRQSDALAVHRLVGDIVRERLGATEAGSRVAAAVSALRRAFPTPPEDHRNWPRSARLLPHVLVVAELAPPTAELARLLNSSGIYLASRAQFRAAAAALERAMRIEEGAYGRDHPDLAVTLGNLALVLQILGDLVGARERLEGALRIEQAAYGPDHPTVARTLINLGAVLKDQGELETASRCLECALRIKEAAYGPVHPEVAMTLGNLGLVLRRLGEPSAALEHHERALRIFEAAYGGNHPEVARALDNLATVLRILGEPEEARELQERALCIFEDAYGVDHPAVAITLANLANLQQRLGDLDGARERRERALRIFESAYGHNHPDVARILTDIGEVLKDLGDFAGARARYEQALRIFEAAYDPDHPLTRSVRSALESI